MVRGEVGVEQELNAPEGHFACKPAMCFSRHTAAVRVPTGRIQEPHTAWLDARDQRTGLDFDGVHLAAYGQQQVDPAPFGRWTAAR